MIKERTRVQDDLYQFVNQEWIDKAIIPDDKPMTGGFSDLDKQVEEILMHEFRQMDSGKTEYPDHYIKKAVELFHLAKDTNKRNQEGIQPIEKILNEINLLTDIEDLNKHLTDFVLEGLPLPFTLHVDVNMKDTMHHAILFGGPSVILPDTTYYKEGMESQKTALLGIWSKMVDGLLQYTDLTVEERQQYINDAIQFDAILSTLVKSSEEWSEYTKVYNPMKFNKVVTLLKPIHWKKLIMEIFHNIPDEIIVAEPRFLKGFQTVLNEDTFPLYKHWAYIQAYLDKAGFLSEEIREIGTTYTKALSGVTSSPTIEKQAYQIASNYYSEAIGVYYGKKYFGEEAKKDVIEMVEEIVDTYKNRIARNDFLSPETKEKAIVKLDKMVIKMGYPDQVNPLYDKLIFDKNDSLCEAIAKLERIKLEDNFSKLYQEVDRKEWVMPGHMVNACYNPFTNDITFPAAILQAPFYSIKQSRSENLGGIGAVIGHEISHAFDNNGAKCDENGNLSNWWTKEDFKKFQAKTRAMVKQFDGIELEWGKVNGAFVVSENIADNGGMAVTLEIMNNMKNADYEQYFYNWARIWCMKARPEFLQLLLSVDVHSPSILRANMQPRNFEEWYQTFHVKRTDQMYITPKKRIVIW